ncbi:MAG: M23 family metallopeptidase [Spirochaetaceae bacterium]|nr:M23 family metallopeptidase [Spirochaetaceae bacterium]
MVRALHAQRVAAPDRARAAFVRELKRQSAASLRPRHSRFDEPFDFSPRRAAQLTVVPAGVSEAADRARAASLRSLWRRGLFDRLQSRLRGRFRVIVSVAVAAAAAVIPAGLVIAAARPQGPPTVPGPADSLIHRDVAPADSSSAEAARDGVPDLSLRSYLVRADDSLSEIAHRFGIDLDTLISFNAIRDASELQEGVELTIPNASGLSYSVRSGDTLSEIAARHGVRLTELMEWNDLPSSALGVGQKLFIPGASLPMNARNAVLGRLFLKPVPGRVVTPFGHHPDPVTGIRRFHDGIDIEHAADTPVAASMAGRVGRVGVNGTYGRYLVLVHADGYQTLYARLSQAHVVAGALVAQSQVIGTIGAPGDGTSSHLHFAIFKAGQPVDPSRYLH